MMSLWDALRMNMMISYQELVRTFLRLQRLCKQCWVFVTQQGCLYAMRIIVQNLTGTVRICAADRDMFKNGLPY
ncbi:Uncharacterised protein [Enterobacter roggenkampii]|nr:Uncharacterised protein [Enterobacter roggenkampii]